MRSLHRHNSPRPLGKASHSLPAESSNASNTHVAPQLIHGSISTELVPRIRTKPPRVPNNKLPSRYPNEKTSLADAARGAKNPIGRQAKQKLNRCCENPPNSAHITVR
jgi:hypothetical protein